MAKLQITGTGILRKNRLATSRNVVNQGGARSSKTYSLCQLFIERFFSKTNWTGSIVRKTFPALKGSVMRDFFEILREAGVYKEDWHNKTDSIYYNKQRNNLIEFFGMDQPQKVRGRKRIDCWANEANELTAEDFKQLNLRTEGQMFFDFNPSDLYHWIYDDIIPRADSTVIKSTYQDNPFLPDEIVREIEYLKESDPNAWLIYGKGEIGQPEHLIYTNWQVTEVWPTRFDHVIHGIDFGFTNPNVLLEIGETDGNYWIRELIYETRLTNAEFIDRAKELINKSATIYADSAEPDKIREWNDAGFHVKPADKDVKNGIDFCKRGKTFLHAGSVNLIKEHKAYAWQRDRDDKVIDGKPVKFNDHAMDAKRYGIYTHFRKHRPNITNDLIHIAADIY